MRRKYPHIPSAIGVRGLATMQDQLSPDPSARFLMTDRLATVRDTSVLPYRPQADHRRVVARLDTARGFTARMPDVGENGLHGPARDDLVHVVDFQVGLEVAYHAGQAGEGDHVAIERAGGVGIAREHGAGAELVVRPARHHSGKDDPAVRIEIDRIAVRRARRNAAEYRHPAVGRAVLR